MPVVTIQQAAGRTVEQRRNIVERVTQALVEVYEVPPEAVTVFLQEYEDESWGKVGKLNVDR